MQIVFQDTNSSLNPRMLVKDVIAEPLVINGMKHGRKLDERVNMLLEVVVLNPIHSYRYPHEFSGGQRQRICIARALALINYIFTVFMSVSFLFTVNKRLKIDNLANNDV